MKALATAIKRSILSEREAFWESLTSAELFDKFGINLSDEVDEPTNKYDLLIAFKCETFLYMVTFVTE